MAIQKTIAETLGNIKSKLGVDIYLYDKWPNKKGTSVQTLLQTLGFKHEQKHLDGCSVVDVRAEDGQYKPWRMRYLTVNAI